MVNGLIVLIAYLFAGDIISHSFDLPIPGGIIGMVLMLITLIIRGKVDEPEEKLKITKMAWETKGTRSVKNNITIKQKFSLLNVAKDVLITSQLRTALILNKNVKAANFNIDTINQKTYVFGIAYTEDEKKEIIQEAKQIVDLKEIVTSILMVSDLSRQRE